MKTAADLLNVNPQPLRSVSPSASVYDALQVLAEHEVGALLVMDGPHLAGIVSERDYTRKVALQGRSSRETTVADIMTRELTVVSPQTRSSECMALMSARHIRHLPVVDQGRPVGMLSIRDILDDIIADQQATIEQLENYIRS